jgi:hypothetical protein
VPAAKLVVTESKGGSQITLIGSSGTPLLTSKVFSEPRGKGATLRALKGLLGENVVVDDQTAAAPKAVAAAPRPRQRAITKPVAPTGGSRPKAARPRRTRKAK